MSLHVQFLTLSLMAGSGVVLGIGFDIIEVLAHEFRLRRWTSAFMDIGYWLVATLFVFQVLVYANDGQVRMFVFIGLFVGVIIYFYLLSRIVRFTVNGVLTLFLRLLRGVSRILYTLLIRPLIYLYRLLQIILGFLLAISIFLGKFMIQCVRYVSKLIMRWF
jgi:spore cortex biosynthesis protein YabQ